MKLIVGIILGIFIAFVVLTGLYLWSVMPNLRRKPQTAELKKWMYAHRGLHDNSSDAPENSLAAFRKAVEAGFGIEMDIQLSKDKVPVVFHDYTLERICKAEGKVSDYTLSELQKFTLCDSREHIPTFAEALSEVKGKVPLIVEFKIEKMDLSLCPIADKLLEGYDGLYCMESFHPLAVRWYRSHHPEVVRGQLADRFLSYREYRSPLFFFLQNLLLNFLSRPDFVAYNCRYSGMISRKLCHGLFRNTSVAWTVKSGQQLEEIRKQFDIYIFDSFLPENTL